MIFYALTIAEQLELEEPLTYKEAMESKDKDKWLKAMNDEIDPLLKNKTWTLVDKVEGLVARGFTQEYGIDYNKAFSHVCVDVSYGKEGLGT